MPDNTPHVPTDKSRAEVSALISFGNTQEEVASYIGICVDTLAKYYRTELDTSIIRANAQVARALYNKAVNENDFSSQKFWLQTRAKWRTSDKDGEQKLSTEDTLTKIRDMVNDLNKINSSDI